MFLSFSTQSPHLTCQGIPHGGGGPGLGPICATRQRSAQDERMKRGCTARVSLLFLISKPANPKVGRIRYSIRKTKHKKVYTKRMKNHNTAKNKYKENTYCKKDKSPENKQT